MVLFGDWVDLCLSGVGCSSARDSPDFRSPEVSISANICWMKKQKGIQNKIISFYINVNLVLLLTIQPTEKESIRFQCMGLHKMSGSGTLNHQVCLIVCTFTSFT